MRKILFFILIVFVIKGSFAGTIGIKTSGPPVSGIEKKKLTPCVQALLNNAPLSNGTVVSQDATGTLTVQNDSDQKVYFNLTLKTNINKKNEPPIFLRFVKMSKIDIRKVLDYAKTGDEIYIEQYVATPGTPINCAPSSFIIT